MGSYLKWKSHTSIARTVARELGLSMALEEVLVQGSVDPDKCPDLERIESGQGFWRKVPHHSPTRSLIISYAWRARICLLRGDDGGAMYNLGRALHYLQDRTVGFSNRQQHHRRENRIGEWEVDSRAIRLGVGDAVSSPRYVEGLVRSVKPVKRPERAMSLACYDSAALASAVIGSSRLPMGFERRYRRSRRTSVLVLLATVALTLIGIWEFLETEHFHFVLLIPFSAGLAVASCAHRRRTRTEARWFGLE